MRSVVIGRLQQKIAIKKKVAVSFIKQIKTFSFPYIST